MLLNHLITKGGPQSAHKYQRNYNTPDPFVRTCSNNEKTNLEGIRLPLTWDSVAVLLVTSPSLKF